MIAAATELVATATVLNLAAVVAAVQAGHHLGIIAASYLTRSCFQLDCKEGQTRAAAYA